MGKMTRVQKYKELRDSMKEEVSIERQTIVESVEDDDFLSFIPKKEEEVNVDDTLMNPLSYETLDEKPVEVKEAIHVAKRNVGKEHYDTRLDILNKIKGEDKVIEDELKDIDFSEGYVVNQNNKKMSLLEKLAAMSPEEDVDEFKKFEEEQKKNIKIEPVKEETEDIKLFTELMEEEKEVNNEEKSNKLLTVLNTIIIILIIVFVCFIGVFAYQLLF